MTIGPSTEERVARARSDLRIGLPVMIGNDMVAAVETLHEGRVESLISGGNAVMAITARRAATLKTHVYDDDLARIAIPSNGTAEWLRSVADPTLDMTAPLKGPFTPIRGGDATVHRAALRLAKSAQLLPAVLVVPGSQPEPGLTQILPQEVVTDPGGFSRVVSGRVPLRVATDARVHVFRPGDAGVEHYALEAGQPDRAGAPLTRLHSACFTGDILGSLKCDCGPQLDAALAAIGAEGAGVLLYLNQEGRGIGLANKMRAYALQDQGFDTVEANHRLGFEDDERDFRIGAGLLSELGFRQVRLMTNNPAKVAMLEASGVAVTERVPLVVGQNPLNARYLDVKARKSGHIL